MYNTALTAKNEEDVGIDPVHVCVGLVGEFFFFWTACLSFCARVTCT